MANNGQPDPSVQSLRLKYVYWKDADNQLITKQALMGARSSEELYKSLLAVVGRRVNAPPEAFSDIQFGVYAGEDLVESTLQQLVDAIIMGRAHYIPSFEVLPDGSGACVSIVAHYQQEMEPEEQQQQQSDGSVKGKRTRGAKPQSDPVVLTKEFDYQLHEFCRVFMAQDTVTGLYYMKSDIWTLAYNAIVARLYNDHKRKIANLTIAVCERQIKRYLQSVNRAVNGNTRTKPLSEKGKADRLAAAAAWNEKFYSHYDNDTVPQMYPFISKAAEQVAEAAAAVATAAQSLGEPKKQSPLQDLAAAAAAASDAAYAEKENTAEQAAAPSGQAARPPLGLTQESNQKTKSLAALAGTDSNQTAFQAKLSAAVQVLDAKQNNQQSKRSRGCGEGDLLTNPSLLGETKVAKKQKAAQEKQQQTDCLGMPAPGTRTKSGRLVNKKGKSSPAAADGAKNGTKRAPPQVVASIEKMSKAQRNQLLQMLMEEQSADDNSDSESDPEDDLDLDDETE